MKIEITIIEMIKTDRETLFYYFFFTNSCFQKGVSGSVNGNKVELCKQHMGWQQLKELMHMDKQSFRDSFSQQRLMEHSWQLLELSKQQIVDRPWLSGQLLVLGWREPLQQP